MVSPRSYGLHDLLGPVRPYIYITMLRKPAARMASWFAYCAPPRPKSPKRVTSTPGTTYSRDKCHSAPLPKHSSGSRLLSFYAARKAKYEAFDAAKVAAGREAAGQPATFHPNWLERGAAS